MKVSGKREKKTSLCFKVQFSSMYFLKEPRDTEVDGQCGAINNDKW